MRKEQTERAPLLYDLTSLQRDANGRFGFSASRTLRAAQSLYEGRKAITYPRTSSRYLSGDLVAQLKPTARDAAADPAVRAVRPLRARARAAPARARRERRAGRRPPRDHPHRRGARRRRVLGGRATDLRPDREAVPRRIPPAREVRAHDRGHRGGWRDVPYPRQDHPRGRLARRVRGGAGRAAGAGGGRGRGRRAAAPRAGHGDPLRGGGLRGEGDAPAGALHGGDPAVRDGDGREARGRRGSRPRR